MTEKTMDDALGLLREGGCRSVHIGGGEPFLDFDGLLMLLQKANKHGINVDYIETNACWATDEETIVKHINALRKVGADTFCISLDPFHAEYVPYAYPLRLAQVCQKENFGFFLWQERFLPMLRNTDPNKAHTRAELEQSIGKGYIRDTANAYGIRMGGRAVTIEAEYHENKPIDSVLNSTPCRSLVSTGHFHVDMYNRFLPPGCTGIAIPLEDAVRGISDGKYPVFDALLSGGVAELYEFAKTLGFEADPKGYASGCNLCFFICKYLSLHGDCNHMAFAELDKEHYTESLRREYSCQS